MVPMRQPMCYATKCHRYASKFGGLKIDRNGYRKFLSTMIQKAKYESRRVGVLRRQDVCFIPTHRCFSEARDKID
jgi:hypothetical protein